MDSSFLDIPTSDMPSYFVYREGTSSEPVDVTAPLLFYPPHGSDELFDALRSAFPHLRSHSERVRDATIAFLIEERQAEQNAQFTPPAFSTDTSPIWDSLASSSSSFSNTPEQFLIDPIFTDDNSPSSTTTTTTFPKDSFVYPDLNPPPLSQMTGVFSITSACHPKERTRRRMTEEERAAYRQRRLVKACDRCAKRKRKCLHNQSENRKVETAIRPTATKTLKPLRPSNTARHNSEISFQIEPQPHLESRYDMDIDQFLDLDTFGADDLEFDMVHDHPRACLSDPDAVANHNCKRYRAKLQVHTNDTIRSIDDQTILLDRPRQHDWQPLVQEASTAAMVQPRAIHTVATKADLWLHVLRMVSMNRVVTRLLQPIHKQRLEPQASWSRWYKIAALCRHYAETDKPDTSVKETVYSMFALQKNAAPSKAASQPQDDVVACSPQSGVACRGRETGVSRARALWPPLPGDDTMFNSDLSTERFRLRRRVPSSGKFASCGHSFAPAPLLHVDPALEAMASATAVSNAAPAAVLTTSSAALPLTTPNAAATTATSVTTSTRAPSADAVPTIHDAVYINRLMDHVRYRDHHGRPPGAGYSMSSPETLPYTPIVYNIAAHNSMLRPVGATGGVADASEMAGGLTNAAAAAVPAGLLPAARLAALWLGSLRDVSIVLQLARLGSTEACRASGMPCAPIYQDTQGRALSRLVAAC